jgi:hypothetical protein
MNNYINLIFLYKVQMDQISALELNVTDMEVY